VRQRPVPPVLILIEISEADLSQEALQIQNRMLCRYKTGSSANTTEAALPI
jgi:hypothetical protein